MGIFDPCLLSDFARSYGFHYEIWDPFALADEILLDMERGLNGLTSSLPMLPSNIIPVSKAPAGKTVLALDAGGTNLRASLVSFNDNNKAAARIIKKAPMPGTRGQASAEQFFDEIAETALPLLSESKIEGIGFTFSYPIEITEETDGILLAFSKEVNAPAVVGRQIGKELREAFYRKGNKYTGPIILLNDTAATLLSGLVSIPVDGEPHRPKNVYNFSGGPVIGFILGTGFNTAYTESFIPKIGFSSKDSPQIVVCESGNFNIRARGKLDIEYDNTTKNPGTYTLEKAAAGAYLGPLTLHILKQAVRDNVIKFKKSAELLAMGSLETRVLNEFTHNPLAAEGPLGSLFGPDEGEALAAVQYLVSIITERGALFSAAVLAAIVARVNSTYEPYLPVRIAVEGTTYLVYKGMRRSLDSRLHQMLTRDKPRPYVISPVEQASLYGAAAAAISRI